MRPDAMKLRRKSRRVIRPGMDRLEDRQLLATGVDTSGLSLSALAIAQATPSAYQAAQVTTQAVTTPVTTSATTGTITSDATSSTSVVGPRTSQKIRLGSTIDTVSISGPGSLTARSGPRGVVITLNGTTSDTQLSVAQTKAGAGASKKSLVISRLNVRSGQLGGIDAGIATLNGQVAGLGSIGSITLGAVVQNSTLDVAGNLDTLTIGSVNLSPGGRIHVAGQVTGQVTFGSLNDIGGVIEFDQDINSISVGNATMAGSSLINVSGNVTGTAAFTNLNLIGGKVEFDGNSVANLAISGTLTASNQAELRVHGSVTGTANLGNLNLNSGDVELSGSVATLASGNIAAGPLGQVIIDGNVTSSASLGSVNLAGGSIHFRGNVAGLAVGATTLGTGSTLQINGQATSGTSFTSLDLEGGSVNFGGGVTGPLSVNGNLKAIAGSSLAISGSTVGPVTLSKVDLEGGNLVFAGGLGDLSAGDTTIAQGGAIRVGGQANGNIAFASLNLAGGLLDLDRGLDQGLTVTGDLIATAGGAISVAGNVAGDVNLATVNLAGGDVTFGGSVGGLIVGQMTLGTGSTFEVSGAQGSALTFESLSLPGGTLKFDHDVTSGLTVDGDLIASLGGGISVGRDLASMNVLGDLILGANSELLVARNAPTIAIQGNLDTTGGGQVSVGGNLALLSVMGVAEGHGNEDLRVGLNLGSLVVRGGLPNEGGVLGFDIDVVKTIDGIDISQGLFHSRITAGVSIDGGTPAGPYNIGPDGVVSVLDSIITAGVSITNIVISGDVVSDSATVATGTFTRIVAGELRDQTFLNGAFIDNFRIVGNLIDAVLSADVEPNPNTHIYDKPAGTNTVYVTVNAVDFPVVNNNHSAPPFADTKDPVLTPGSINASFIGALTVNGNPSPPTQSTLTGQVITVTGSFPYDNPGFFAENTRGVYVGPLPA